MFLQITYALKQMEKSKNYFSYNYSIGRYSTHIYGERETYTEIRIATRQ